MPLIMGNNMNEERIIEIETKIAHQEFLMDQLSKVLYEQQSKIDQLENAITSLVKRLQEGADSGLEIGPANEKPPHY